MAESLIDLAALIECYRADPAMTHQKWVLWAADCAERVLAVFESAYPGDGRPRLAVDAARRWAMHPTGENKDAAARAAAAVDTADAARATRAAADAAIYAIYAADAADAAYAAARAAAYAAAYAARAAETQWQAFRLMDIYHG